MINGIILNHFHKVCVVIESNLWPAAYRYNAGVFSALAFLCDDNKTVNTVREIRVDIKITEEVLTAVEAVWPCLIPYKY